MKTEHKALEKCRVELKVTLSNEEADGIVKEVERSFVKNAQLPGFRKGKVPIERIRKEFAANLENEIRSLTVNRYLKDALKAEQLDFVAVVELKEITRNSDGAEFTVIVEVKPTFKLPAYKELKIEKRDTSVTEEMLNSQLAQLRKQCAKYKNAETDTQAAEGDFIQIDYAGVVDGKPIEEVSADAKAIGSAKGSWIMLEEGKFLPEVIDAVKGMKCGETKNDIKVKFAEENVPDGLKGKEATYTVTLTTLRSQILPTDEEFVAAMKAESYEALVKSVRERMENYRVAQESARRENEAAELLLKKADFDIPESQLQNATHEYLKQLAERAQYSGLDASYFEKNRESILKDATEHSAKQIRLWYILEAIAKAEKLGSENEDLGKKAMEFVLANTK
ncbi:MAG: trigger factor [Kiritimatiellae bacterium]|nr:trigger factor [Kiritimatiellia bacterium]